MRSPSITDYNSPADLIALSKARRLAGQTDAGSESQPPASGQALALPEDVITLSSQQSDSGTLHDPAPDLRKTSLQVTPTEKKALLGPDTSPYRLSIYG